MTRVRHGVTLIELVVVLAILGVMATVAGLTMHTAAPRTPPDATTSRIAALRNSALTSGRVITGTVFTENCVGVVTAYPDGRVLSTVGDIDPLTGRPRARDR